MINKKKILLSLIFLFLWFFFPLDSNSSDKKNLTVHFKFDRYNLSEKDKAEIVNFAKKLKPAGDEYINITAHADSTGTKKYNYKLSKKRGFSVKNKIIESGAMDSDRIKIMARGEDEPIADNKTSAGRRKNRRAKIELKDKFSSMDCDEKLINEFIEKAKTFIRRGDLRSAIVELKKAKALCAYRSSQWYSTYGIVGFYGGITPEDLIPIFQVALAMDRYNFEGEDYLGRTLARKKFFSGEINEKMGRSLEDPIKVETFTQEYEYIKLFGVKGLTRHFHHSKNMEIWECKADNKIIKYYFELSNVYTWAFKKQKTIDF